MTTSGVRWTPNFSRTVFWASAQSASMSLEVAWPLRFMKKLPCLGEIWAWPMALPLRPARSMSWPAGRRADVSGEGVELTFRLSEFPTFGKFECKPGGFLKKEPVVRPGG